MTLDTIQDGSRTEPRGRYLTPAQHEALLMDIAKGILPLEAIAATHGRSYSQVKKISSAEKERIGELRREWYEDDTAPAPLWIRDKLNRLAIRQGALVAILEQQSMLMRDIADMELAEDPNGRNDLITLEQYKIVRDQWAKLETLKQQVLRHIDEIEGQLPTRSPAVVAEGSKMTYTVTGVDVAETVRQWQEQAT